MDRSHGVLLLGSIHRNRRVHLLQLMLPKLRSLQLQHCLPPSVSFLSRRISAALFRLVDSKILNRLFEVWDVGVLHQNDQQKVDKVFLI